MKYRMAGALLSLVGLLLATYLYLYKIGEIGTLACGTGSCETVQLSPYSRFLGVEVAMIGICGYGLLLLLSLLGLQASPGRRSWVGRLLLTGSGLGLVFTCYLTYVELFVIEAICRWCVASAAIITLIFVAAVLDWRAGAPSQESRSST
ncbi:MAG TPA: vitamin K epoxide reductase family protein [Gemmatimonadales bacterium]|nr:vitamin K epoxide reductase family protein [Gemmatimonadales bacterium]